MTDQASLDDSLSTLDAVALAHVIDSATARLAEAPLAGLTEQQLLDLADTRERTRRRSVGTEAAVLMEISDRNVFRTAGYLSVHQYLAQGLRLGDGEARRRRNLAEHIGPRTALTGEPLAPQLPECAAGVADGEIGADHVSIVASTLAKVPSAVPADVVADAEAQLADEARHMTADAVSVLGNRLLAHLDPDGQLTDDADRKRQRGFRVGPQDRQLMSTLVAHATPALRAKLDVVLESWAAPGMNNPDDPDSPFGSSFGVDPAVLAAAAERDTRNQTQRNHDALEALCDHVLSEQSTGPWSKRPLSSELVITVTESELAAGAGVAVTATGARVPVTDLVSLAADAIPHLEVFADASSEVLYLGRGARLASKAQRLALFGRDRGCTAPGCTRPFSRTQAHHMPDWQDGGPTDIDHLGGACGSHNRRVGPHAGQWETKIMRDGPHRGRVAWRPAGSDDEWQVNPLHHHEPRRRPHGPPTGDDDRESAATRFLRDIEGQSPPACRHIDVTWRLTA
ncbi:MAG: DUF222 domain-containing protein [Gordonia sp. (in: high G+C Gram-positive bacteria)]